MANASRAYAPWLWLLATLFLLRVIAQPAALLIDAWFLPPFESWHSGALPYPVLVATQLAILGWLVHTAWRFARGGVLPRKHLGRVILLLGSLYFTGMLGRLILGATIMDGQRWFASPVPTVFHLVLAAYLIAFGHFHFSQGTNDAREPKEPT